MQTETLLPIYIYVQKNNVKRIRATIKDCPYISIRATIKDCPYIIKFIYLKKLYVPIFERNRQTNFFCWTGFATPSETFDYFAGRGLQPRPKRLID